MSPSASFLFQGGSVSDPFPAASEREMGPTVKGKLKSGKRNLAQQKESGSVLFVTGRIQALDGEVADIFLPKPRPGSLRRSWFPLSLYRP